MAIRRIRAEEALLLRDIRLRALAESPAAFSSTAAKEEAFPTEVWEARTVESASGDRAATFVAIGEGSGWLGLVTVLGPSHDVGDAVNAELVSMWVSPEARGRGNARALVAAAIGFAQQIGAPALRLAVTHGNPKARRFYEEFGFSLTCQEGYESSHPCHGEVQMSLVL